MEFKVTRHNRELPATLKELDLKDDREGRLCLLDILRDPNDDRVVSYGDKADPTYPDCPVPWNYHVAKPVVEPKYARALNSFKTIDASWYVNHYEQFKKDLDMLKSVDQFMSTRSKLLKKPATVRQRAFQIFQNEKQFDRGNGQKLFERVTGLQSGLNMYETFMPISVWSKQTNPKRILISENLDPFYDFQQAIRASLPICGQLFDGLVYGGGNGLYASLRDPYFDKGILAGKQLYYVGDIDVKGIMMLDNWQRYADEYQRVVIKPAVAIYQKMIAKARQYDHLSDVKKTTQREFKGFDEPAMQKFLGLFSKEYQAYLKSVLPAYRIPQEILTREDLS